MTSYSAKSIEGILKECREFGYCFIGNIESGSLTSRGLKKIREYLRKNELEDQFHMMTGNDFPGYIDGDMYMACAR